MKLIALTVAALVLSPLALAGEPASQIPIREITAFKDGHALVLRSGRAQIENDGAVRITDLPRPVLGTFWPNATGDGVELGSVSVERVTLPVSRPASSTEAMLRANVGRKIIFRDAWDVIRFGELVELVEREAYEEDGPLQQFYDNNARTQKYRTSKVRVPGETLAVIREHDSVATLPIGEIRDLRFEDGMPARTLEQSEEIEQMTLRLRAGGDAKGHADISLMYLEMGVRWVPSYRMTILDDNTLRVELRAGIVNELADLDDVTMNFAIGVPSFVFEGVPDPLALREVFEDLGMFFRDRFGNETGGMLALTTVSSQGSVYAGAGRTLFNNINVPQSAPESPTLLGGGRTEDLYVFTVEHVTLNKGGRMSLPLLSYELPMEQLYTLDLPVTLPDVVRRGIPSNQQQALSNILNARYPRHVLRITNDNPGGHPITTAPSMIVRDGRVLAQGVIGYTAPGGTVDLEVGVAVDIEIDEDEEETSREPNSYTWNGDWYNRSDIRHRARVTNHKDHPVTLEYRKFAFGTSKRVSEPGAARTLPSYTDEIVWPDTVGQSWRWWNWPYYWRALNPPTVYTWTRTLKPGEAMEFDAEWYFYAR